MSIPSVNVAAATFSDGTDIQFNSNDIVVFVGPNNAGKSAALRNIRHTALRPGDRGEVVTRLEIRTEGTSDQVTAWFAATYRLSGHNPPHYAGPDGSIDREEIPRFWRAGTGVDAHFFIPFFFDLVPTESRLTAANPARSIAITTEPLNHPIHRMQADDALEGRVSGCFRQAFGQDLMVHRNAGSEVPLYCGEKPVVAGAPTSIAYYKAIESCVRLEKQGDGMRSFMGALLHCLTGAQSVVLVDEPEAFLHPPQARLMGRMIATEIPNDRQVFIGTHSGDLLRGLLDANSTRVRIIRLQRDGDVNRPALLDNVDIERIWSDSLLRHSNILDGVFHEKVIVCESDSDCRFFAAVNDAMEEATPALHRKDVMFIHCGGKDRLPIVVQALRSIGIPVRAVADFDILQNERLLESLFRNLGGEWHEIQQDWRRIKNVVDAKKSELSTDEVKKEIAKILDETAHEIVPPDASERIRKILKRSSPWAIAKQTGKQFIPGGDDFVACETVLGRCKCLGLHIVEVGELENFVRSVGQHGPAWVNDVLATKDLNADAELEPARQFVKALIA